MATDTLVFLPPPPTGVAEPCQREQPCEVCSETVRFVVVTTPDGCPDLIRALFPDNAWFGWRRVDDSETVAITVICSLACQVEWLDSNYGPGI